VKVGCEKMTQEKTMNVAIVKMDSLEKVKWLKIWNGDQAIQDQIFFPPWPIRETTLNPWLSRITF
jgi:hypothetical protein